MSRRRLPARWGATASAAVFAIACACAPSASSGPTSSPGSGRGGVDPDVVGPHEGDSSQELVTRMQRMSVQREDLAPQSMADATVCESVCVLSSGICDAQVKLCAIADEHPQSEDYQRECRLAKAECREAQESCEACAKAHGERDP